MEGIPMASDPFFGPHSPASRRQTRQRARELREEARASQFALHHEVLAARASCHRSEQVLTESRWLAATRPEPDWASLRCPECRAIRVRRIVLELPGTFFECLACGHIWRLRDDNQSTAALVKRRA